MANHRTRRKRDCPHGGIHKHGTPVAYRSDACGCEPCVAADRKQTSLRRLRRLEGRALFVDPAPVAAHVKALQAQGMGVKRIAEAAGCGVTTVGWLVWPRTDTGRTSTKIRAVNARKILSVRHSTTFGSVVDATGTHRRIQALVANGWCLTELGRQLGFTNRAASVRVGNLLKTNVQAHNAQRVAELYERLWNQQPPADTPNQRAAITMARNLADRNGWVVPLAWNEEDIDNPDAQPWRPACYERRRVVDELTVQLITQGAGDPRLAAKATTTERVEAIRRLAAQGLNDTSIGKRLGMERDTVCQNRIRWNIPAGNPTTERAA